MAHSPLPCISPSMLRCGVAICTAWLLICSPAFAATAAEPRVELYAPRASNYVMGDPVEHTLSVTLPKDYALESEFLPQAGAVSDWLDLRQILWEKEDQGNQTRYRFRISYRVFKGVRAAETLTIPPLPLRFRAAGVTEVQTPAWSFVLNPIIPAATPDNLVTVRDAMPATALALGPHRLRLAIFTAGVLAVLVHLARRYQLLSLLFKPKGPFERAQRKLQKLARRRSDPEVYRQAFRFLHRALDETAGQTLLAGQLERFLGNHPPFAELAGELEQFFVWSQRLFFAVPAAPPPADYPFERLEALCLRCELLERAKR